MGWITNTCFCVLLCTSILCITVKLERGRVTYFNPKYVESSWGNVTRYGRKSDYYVNTEFITKCAFGNNLTVNIKFYEFRWNAYKISIVDFRYKLCDFIEKDPYIGGPMAAATGIKCPLPAGKHTLMNLTAHLEDFPNVFPFEKGRANLIFRMTSTGESIAEAEVYFTLKNELKSKKRG